MHKHIKGRRDVASLVRHVEYLLNRQITYGARRNEFEEVEKSVCTKNRDHEYDDDTANMYNRHGFMARLFVSIYTFIKKKNSCKKDSTL